MVRAVLGEFPAAVRDAPAFPLLVCRAVLVGRLIRVCRADPPCLFTRLAVRGYVPMAGRGWLMEILVNCNWSMVRRERELQLGAKMAAERQRINCKAVGALTCITLASIALASMGIPTLAVSRHCHLQALLLRALPLQALPLLALFFIERT